MLVAVRTRHSSVAVEATEDGGEDSHSDEDHSTDHRPDDDVRCLSARRDHCHTHTHTHTRGEFSRDLGAMSG